ncbi:hypothetical protein QFZ87_000044 [Bacillus sp. SLBN-46]|nr:hypothetical protein [Bacillus sp. SLBN-46]
MFVGSDPFVSIFGIINISSVVRVGKECTKDLRISPIIGMSKLLIY